MAAWRIPREFNVRDYELVGFITAWTIALVLAGGVVFTQGGGVVDIVIAAAVMSCVGKPFWVRLGPSQALADRLQEHGNRFLREDERFYSGHTLWSGNGHFHLERRMDGRLVIIGRGPGYARTIALTQGGATAWRLRIARRGDYVVLQQGNFVRCHRNGYVLGPAQDQSVYSPRRTRLHGNARYLAVSDDGKLIAVGDGEVAVWKLPNDGSDTGTADPGRADGLSAEQVAARQRRQAAAMLISFLALDVPLSAWAEKTVKIPLIGQDIRQQFTFAVIESMLVYGIWLGYRFAWAILLVLTLPELMLSAEQISAEHLFGWPVALMSIQAALLLSPAVRRHIRFRRLSSRRSGRP